MLTWISSLTPATDAAVLADLLPATATGNGMMATQSRDIACEYQTSGASAGSVVCVKLVNGVVDKRAVAKWWADLMDGKCTTAATGTLEHLFTARRIIDTNNNLLFIKSSRVENERALIRAMQEATAEFAQAHP